MYIAMRHLFIRGSYKPLGTSGEALIGALLSLSPEIYGSINDRERVELEGLLYIFQRLPQGIEECRYVKLISREGFQDSNFEALVPAKRRRNCYRIDDEQMYIEMSRGRSDIYDVLTHLTFMYVEAEKIRRNALDHKDRLNKEWHMLEEIVMKIRAGEDLNEEVGFTYLSTLLGRTFEDTVSACKKFGTAEKVNSIFCIAYWLGKRSLEEHLEDRDREISFSKALREKVGHHVYGEKWAHAIKQELDSQGLLDRPIHIISSNMHSVVNTLYGLSALKKKKFASLEALAQHLSQDENGKDQNKVHDYGLKHGLTELSDSSGTNINVQIINCTHITGLVDGEGSPWISSPREDVIIVMDYAFGEQAYETMDELLKPYEKGTDKIPLDVRSINIMGKAGILEGTKGDLMIPDAFIFEGSADNYPVENQLSASEFEGQGLGVYSGAMITVLGTSLQNRDILRYFLKSSWHCVGLEMEGAHYQKAIQAASKIRASVSPEVKLRYAYYASDNPLETGATLASGSLGIGGVKPTYLITTKILDGILRS